MYSVICCSWETHRHWQNRWGSPAACALTIRWPLRRLSELLMLLQQLPPSPTNTARSNPTTYTAMHVHIVLIHIVPNMCLHTAAGGVMDKMQLSNINKILIDNVFDS